MPDKKVTVVIPVYADWESLQNCISSLKAHLAEQHKVIIVNDFGPEADMLETNIKNAINGSKQFDYYANPKNLGFIQTCNRAVYELDRTSNDILLLNSDTKVTKGFLEEMLAVLYSNPKIAAVSPRTNNATIFTVPLSTMAQKGIDPEKSYQVFKKLSQKLKYPRHTDFACLSEGI
jgi:GT2 family glycosyltransferase